MNNKIYNNENYVGDILYPGRTQHDKMLNRSLLNDYDYEKYVEGLTGYAGQDLQNILRVSTSPAQRTRVGSRGHYKAGFAKMPDGTLLTAPCVPIYGDNGPYDITFDIYVYKSKDDGLTWNKVNKTPLKGKEPSMICLKDGTIILTSQTISNGKMDYSMPVYRSTDNGVTWDISYLPGNRDYPRNLFIDKDGSVCFIRSKCVMFEFEEGYPEDAKAGLIISRSYDSGLTWTHTEGKIQNWDYPGFMEVSSIRLKSGKLLAALRHQPSGTKGEGFENTLLTWSKDNGANWSTPVVISRTGEVHFNLLQLEDGRLLGTYSNYHLPYGVCVVTSNDEGVTWDYDNIYQLAVSADYYVGWGVTLQLNDGYMATSYATTTHLSQPRESTSCEVVKWKL